MQSRIEQLIKIVYKKWKAHQPKALSGHPDEEAIAGFLEGRLSEIEVAKLRLHIITCNLCAEILATQAKLGEIPDEPVPEAFIQEAKNLVKGQAVLPVLEIMLRLKDNLLELLHTTGDILVGQELVPAPVLRSRQVKDFKDEVVILKDFGNLHLEIKVENKQQQIFNLVVTVREKESKDVIKDLRVTLVKDNTELESYLADTGRVTFEHLCLGKYSIELANPQERLAAVVLDIKT